MLRKPWLGARRETRVFAPAGLNVEDLQWRQEADAFTKAPISDMVVLWSLTFELTGLQR